MHYDVVFFSKVYSLDKRYNVVFLSKVHSLDRRYDVDFLSKVHSLDRRYDLVFLSKVHSLDILHELFTIFLSQPTLSDENPTYSIEKSVLDRIPKPYRYWKIDDLFNNLVEVSNFKAFLINNEAWLVVTGPHNGNLCKCISLVNINTPSPLRPHITEPANHVVTISLTTPLIDT